MKLVVKEGYQTGQFVTQFVGKCQIWNIPMRKFGWFSNNVDNVALQNTDVYEKERFFISGIFFSFQCGVGKLSGFGPKSQHLECTITSGTTVLFWQLLEVRVGSVMSSLVAKLTFLAWWIWISSLIIFWTLSWHSCSIRAPSRINKPPFMAWLWVWNSKKEDFFLGSLQSFTFR